MYNIKKTKKIFVTRPSVPNKKKFLYFLNSLYSSRVLTTNGPLNNYLEKKLCKFLNVKYLCLTSSGTAALEIALKTLKIKKGVLTSPFSYVATANAANWLGLKTFFCDIEMENLGIDLKKVNKIHRNKYDCILATHAFGLPSNIDEISRFVKNKKTKLIYDASHCFDIKYKKKSILKNGNVSILSFQATKIFNTCEGGAIILNNKKDYLLAKELIHIGFDYTKKKTNFPKEGINAKMSELSCAWGLALLDKYKKISIKRKKAYIYYLRKINEVKFKIIGKKYKFNNYSYLPILFNKIIEKKNAIDKLNNFNIFPREYFFPSLNILKHLGSYQVCKNSEYISKRILCLPLYEDITKKDINKITKILNSL